MGHSYTFGDKFSIFEGILSLLDRISKLRDLRGKLGLFRDYFWTLLPTPDRDLVPKSGL